MCNIKTDEVEAACDSEPTQSEPGAECYCNPSLAQPRSVADPYTDEAYLYCSNDYTYYYTCYNGYIYSEQYDDCVPIPPTCEYFGIFPFPDECTYYYVCNSVGSPGLIEQCQDGEFFDVNSDHCEPVPDESASCTDSDGNPVTGTVPSPLYCDYYLVCDDGSYVSTENCPPGEIFSQPDHECVPDDGTCKSIGYCF